MESTREEQREALEALASYNKRLVKGMRGVMQELSGHRVADTDEYLQKVLQGINWEIAVLNGTMTLINENGEKVNKENVNTKIMCLSEAVQAHNDVRIADAMADLVQVFEHLGQIAAEVAA